MTSSIAEPYVPLLRSLLTALGWHGQERTLAQAVPHDRHVLRVEDLVDTLANVQVSVFESRTELQKISPLDCPGLFIGDDGTIVGVLDHRGNRALIHEPGQSEPRWTQVRPVSGKLIRLISETEDDSHERSEALNLSDHHGELGGLVFASFFTNIFAFATPLFVMALYDRVIPVGSTNLLGAILIGLGIIFASEIMIRVLRSRAVAHMGASVERKMGLALFSKLMSLPLSLLQKSDVNQQLARFRQFEGLRDAFTGSVLNALLDLPFTLLFLVVIYQISPPVALSVAVLALVFALAYLAGLPVQGRLTKAAAATRLELQRSVTELSTTQRSIRRLGAEDLWRDRIGTLIRRTARDARRNRQFTLISQAFGQSVMIVAGVTTVVHGTQAAMDGDMSLGALIASMALVWRVLAPIHALYAAAPQIGSYMQSARQMSRVMALQGEMTRGVAQSHQKSFAGAITARNLMFRYGRVTDAAIGSVSFKIEAGQRVAFTGPNAAGKSTLLHIIDGLYQPQAGAMLLDGIDYRQIAVEDLRAAISYGPQITEFFHGTVAQNLRLTNPLATDDDIWVALRDIGLESEIRHFPEGLETRLTEEFRQTVSPAVLRGLLLARCFVKEAPVYLFDEPCNGLDQSREEAFFRKLDRLRGKCTVIMVTRRPSHYRRMDKVLYFDSGRVLVDDKGEGAIRKIAALDAQVVG